MQGEANQHTKKKKKLVKDFKGTFKKNYHNIRKLEMIVEMKKKT